MAWTNTWTATSNINNNNQYSDNDTLGSATINALVNDVGYLNDRITSEVNAITSQINSINTTLAGKQNTLTFDSTPTANSNNPVTSHGIKTAIENVSIEGDHLFLRRINPNGNEISISSIGLYVVVYSINSGDKLTATIMIPDLDYNSVAYINEDSTTNAKSKVYYNSSTRKISVTSYGFASTITVYGGYKLASLVY